MWHNDCNIVFFSAHEPSSRLISSNSKWWLILVIFAQRVSLFTHTLGCFICIFQLNFLSMWIQTHRRFEALFNIFVEKVVKETICTHNYHITLHLDLMWVVKGIRRRFAPSSTLIWEIEPILLFFRAENFLHVQLGRVRFWGSKSVEHVPRIAQVARIQRFVVF